MNLSYRQYHEHFMSNHNGSTLWECILFISPYPLLVYFVFYILYIYYPTNVRGILITLIHNLRKRSKSFIDMLFMLTTPVNANKRPYISNFRSVIGLLTVFCILAVDFKIFPRQFAKTENYGFSIMDTGVGFYVVSNGIVVKPHNKIRTGPLLKSILPILIIGLLRCIFVKSLDYQEHVSEYGVHWNFFFTLACLKVFLTFLLSIWPSGSLWMSIFLALIHQGLLSVGLESWVIGDTPRDGFITANREGIVSLTGYLSLLLAAVYIGQIVRSTSIDLKEDLILARKTFLISLILLIISLLLQSEWEASRRLVNITYISWVVAISLFFISMCIIIEMSMRILLFIDGSGSEENLTPIIFSSINYNGLFFFLLANILTGLVNITLKTLLLGAVNSIITLTMYMLVLCGVTSLLYTYRIKIKL